MVMCALRSHIRPGRSGWSVCLIDGHVGMLDVLEVNLGAGNGNGLTGHRKRAICTHSPVSNARNPTALSILAFPPQLLVGMLAWQRNVA